MGGTNPNNPMNNSYGSNNNNSHGNSGNFNSFNKYPPRAPPGFGGNPVHMGPGGYPPGGMNQMDMSKKSKFRTVPCKMFHSSQGCKHGEGCHFIHDKNYVGVEIPEGIYPSGSNNKNHNNRDSGGGASGNSGNLNSGHSTQNNSKEQDNMGFSNYGYNQPGFNAQPMVNHLNQPLKNFTRNNPPPPGGDPFRKKFPVTNPRPVAPQGDFKERSEENDGNNFD